MALIIKSKILVHVKDSFIPALTQKAVIIVKVCTHRTQKKKKSFGIKTFIINCITPGWQFSFSLFEILLGLSKHCNTYAKALCLYTCTPNTTETASLDIKEKTTYNQCLCILDGRYIYIFKVRHGLFDLKYV